MSEKKLFCENWEFSLQPFGTDFSEKFEWTRVDIPHDYMIYNTKKLYQTSTGWYRKSFDYKPDGKLVSLRFDAVYMDSKVYVNGRLAGEWKYGYTTFEFDITDLLCEGENVVTVRIDYQEPNSRWYSGAGIFRNVYFKEYAPCHITADGIYISTDIDGNVKVTTQTERPKDITTEQLRVRNTVFDGEKKICSVENACCAFDISRISKAVAKDGRKYSENTDNMKIAEPVLWDINNPHLYTMVTELLDNGEVVDTEVNTFGVRKIEFTCDKGFFLNGRHVKLHGCCEHHDSGCLGAAVNKDAIRRKLSILKTMGINAIRTSHNPPASEFMELTDEMGLLVVSECFDMWEMKKTTYDYGNYFRQWVERDVASWVRRDRNHPSIIAWSVGNEIYDTHTSERGQEIASLLLGFVREHDPRENGYCTLGSNFMQSERAQRCTDILKLAGYNYAERLYEEQHKAHPDWMIYGSETSSVVQSRGIYHFPYSQKILCEDDEQCSALGNTSPGWAAKCTEACIIPDRDAEYCAGQFIWTGFDYIGEPTPYATKNSYFGQFDTAGFAKDSAYIFRIAWTDYKTAPFVHIYPYWDFSEGQVIDIRVASNCPEVELYFDGKLIKSEKFDRTTCQTLTLDAQLEYKKGELMAISYDENKNEVARDYVRSFGDTAEIRVTTDKSVIKADGRELVFLDISAFDKSGNFVANANNRVFVKVSGAGRLVGLDNGDSTDYEQYKGTSRRLFSGKLLAVIASKTQGGEIQIEISSPSLPTVMLSVMAEKCEVDTGVSALEENKPCESECGDVENDIPVRKIEFVCERTTFNAENRELKFKTVCYPENASYKNDIEYRLTTVLGIDTNLAEIKSVEDGVVTVLCKGDGEFYLRGLCKNGTSRNHILTVFKLCGEGLGSATLNPYEFVAGGLFTICQGNAGNGIEHGAGFGGGLSRFGFENVDFGRVGSDRIILPIYMNCSTPVKFAIYDGNPEEDGEIIGEYEHLAPSQWLTYNQPETFTLNKKLKGIHTLVFESYYGFEIKGFTFEKPEEEFSEICAADNNSIYGDKFTCHTDEVVGIGNNVMLDFGVFDFTAVQPKAITITGKSHLPVNSIHVIFTGENPQTEIRTLCEFSGADSYTMRTFPLENISGKLKVSFAFLPGSDFDFKSFKFEK